MIRFEKDKQILIVSENWKTLNGLKTFMVVTMESAVFMGKNYLNNCQSISKTTDLNLEQMLDTSTRFVSEQNEISGWKQLVGKITHWNSCLRLLNTESFILNARKSTFLQNLCCVLGRFFKILYLTMHSWNLKITKTLSESTMSWWNSSGIFSQDEFVAASWRSENFIVEIKWDTREFHRKNHIYVDLERHFLWIKKQ